MLRAAHACMTVMMLSHSNLPACAQESHVGLRGQHAGARRRHDVDIGLLRSGRWIEGLGLLSWVRGSGACIRLVRLCSNANRLLATLHAHTSAREQAQQIRYNFITRAQAYVRSGPPCDSHCEPQCLRLWHSEVYCEGRGVTSREGFRAGAGGGLLGQFSYLCTSSVSLLLGVP